MDYGRVLSRAWEITWRYRILWLFGFIMALASGGGSGGGSNSVRIVLGDGRGPAIGPIAAWLILLLVVVLLVVALVVFVLGIIAHGALIDGARQVEESGVVSGSAAWSAGVRRFWPLLGIDLLTLVAVIVLLLPMLVAIILGIAAVATGGREAGIGGGLLICGGVCYLIPFVVAAILIGFVVVYARRACVLEDLNTVDAIKRGWEVFKRNVGHTLLVGVILMVINLIIGAVFVGGIFSLAAPGLALWQTTRNPALTAVPLCGLGLILFLVALFVTTLLETYRSVVWTLAYRALRARPEASVPAEVELPTA